LHGSVGGDGPFADQGRYEIRPGSWRLRAIRLMLLPFRTNGRVSGPYQLRFSWFVPASRNMHRAARNVETIGAVEKQASASAREQPAQRAGDRRTSSRRRTRTSMRKRIRQNSGQTAARLQCEENTAREEAEEHRRAPTGANMRCRVSNHVRARLLNSVARPAAQTACGDCRSLR